MGKGGLTGAVRALSPLGLLRSKPGSVPLRIPAVQSHGASGSQRYRVAPLPHQAAMLGGGQSSPPVSFDRIREDDARHGAGQTSQE